MIRGVLTDPNRFSTNDHHGQYHHHHNDHGTDQGRLVTDQGLFRPMTGYGQFVPLPPFPPLLYDKVIIIVIIIIISIFIVAMINDAQMREKKESGSEVRAVPRSEEDMATTNGIDQDIPPEVGIS